MTDPFAPQLITGVSVLVGHLLLAIWAGRRLRNVWSGRDGLGPRDAARVPAVLLVAYFLTPVAFRLGESPLGAGVAFALLGAVLLWPCVQAAYVTDRRAHPVGNGFAMMVMYLVLFMLPLGFLTLGLTSWVAILPALAVYAAVYATVHLTARFRAWSDELGQTMTMVATIPPTAIRGNLAQPDPEP